MTKLHLTADLTPNLLNLDIHKIPQNCEFQVVVPSLKTIAIRHYSPPDHDSSVINEMLKAASELEIFETYRLNVEEKLRFASNYLKSIELHQSEVLTGIALWTPNLEQLNLRACYSIKSIRILSSHRLAEKLPEGHQPTTIRVNTANANISPTAMAALTESGRCLIENIIPSDGLYAEPMWSFLTKFQEEKGMKEKSQEEQLLGLIEGMKLWDETRP